MVYSIDSNFLVLALDGSAPFLNRRRKPPRQHVQAKAECNSHWDIRCSKKTFGVCLKNEEEESDGIWRTIDNMCLDKQQQTIRQRRSQQATTPNSRRRDRRPCSCSWSAAPPLSLEARVDRGEQRGCKASHRALRNPPNRCKK